MTCPEPSLYTLLSKMLPDHLKELHDTSWLKKTAKKSALKKSGLEALWQQFPDSITARQWFEQQRWGHSLKDLACPRCYSDAIIYPKSKRADQYRCRSCRYFFSVKQGTVMQSSHLSYQKWTMALFLWFASSQKVSSVTLQHALGITQSSAWKLRQKLKASCPQCGSLFEHKS